MKPNNERLQSAITYTTITVGVAVLGWAANPVALIGLFVLAVIAAGEWYAYFTNQ